MFVYLVAAPGLPYAAQSNKAAKKVKNFTEVMQRPDSAFCASKARRKQQLGAAQTRGRNPKKIQGSRVADVKKDTLMKRPEKYPIRSEPSIPRLESGVRPQSGSDT